MTDNTRRRPGRRLPLDPAKLRAARQAKAWSQTELAEKSGLSPSLVSALETSTSGASAQSVRKLAVVLGMEPGDLLLEPATS
jgi:transcriptional regulator with XRE-family HTH domain